MKFLNLRLLAFGCFTNRTLDFSAADRNFHVIYGANEAGKSTSLRAVKGLLFEIPSRTADDFLHKAANLRVAAELLRQDGQRRTFVRRKGNKDTLLDEQEQPLPATELNGYLGNLGRATFESVFCLDHHVLRQGGEDLLAGKGELAESLFQAGTGLTGLRNILVQLEGDAERIFKPRGSTGSLNQWLGTYEEARRRSRDLALSPKDWTERSEHLAHMQTDLETLRKSLNDQRAQLSRLGRYQVALKHFNQYKLHLAELEQLNQVGLLPPNAPQEHAEVRGTINQTLAQIELTKKRVGELQDQLTQLTVREDLLAHATTISNLVQRMDGYRNALRDLPTVRAEQEQLITEARDLLAELKPGLALEQADTLRITTALRERVNKLAREYPTLMERLDQKKNVRNKAWKNAESAQAELAQCPATPVLDDLEHALENCRAQGDLESQLREEEQALKTLDREVNLLLNRLGLWSGTLSDLTRLRVPLPESVERFDRELQALTKTQDNLAEQAKRLRESLANVERETQSLQLAGAVPTETDLDSARTRREQGWQLVRRAWLEKQADAAAELAFDNQHKLPEAFEQSVKTADDLADRLRREADRCAHLAKLQAGKFEDEKALQEVLKQEAELGCKMADWQAGWRAEWRGTGFTPLTPVEMRGWLGRYAVLLQKAEEPRRIQDRVERLKENLKTHQTALRIELEKLGQTAPANADSPSALMKFAQKFSRQITEAMETRKDLAKSVKRHQQEFTRGEEELQQAQQALDAWRSSWVEALGRAQLPSDTLPEDALALLTKLDRLFDCLREQAGQKSRIDKMREYQEAFEHDVRALVGALATDLVSLPPDAAAEQLHARLARAKSDEVKRQGLQRQLTQETASLAVLESAQSQAEAQRKTLLERAGCNTSAELEIVEQQSQKKRETQQNLTAHREALENQSGGAPLEKFLEELSALMPDELPGQKRELEQQILTDEQRQAELLKETALGAQKLKESDGSIQAAQAAQEAQEALAQVRELSLQYARLRLAAEMLRRQMEQHREKNQDPVICRASELFPRLTRGSFARLKVGFDDHDQPILLGVRPAGEEVRVTSMSDGTRDQLFLALRLASLERQLQSAEPVPLMVDDILINFDDDRAKATLEVLRDISHSTQVLFFTHHTRLKELAREVIGEKQLVVHDL
ncbi:MAG: AAA family ATPase [Verrucomicrobiota bacterium]